MAAEDVPASFSRLPVELLLNIAFCVSDLPSLYALDIASTKFALVFNEYGYQILDSVMRTPGKDQPRRQICDIIRLVVHIRTMCVQFEPSQQPPSLDAFISQHFKDSSDSAACKSIPSCTTPSVLRGVLATATKINCLASHCLAEHMRRCLALRPLHPVDRAMPQLFQFSGIQPEYFKRPGYSYTPHSSGPPSWLEMQRAQRAFWSVQLYLDLCRSISGGYITFARYGSGSGDFQRLGELDLTRLEDFGPRPEPLVASERAVNTVVEYLCEFMGWSLPECKAGNLLVPKVKSNLFLQLPWPHPGPTQDFDWDNEGVGWFPGCDEDYSSQYSGLQALSLQESPGERFLDRMWYMQRFSPVFNIRSMPVFRRLGIAFWDSKRLMGLELLGPAGEDGFTVTGRSTFKDFHMLELAYTWKSVADAAC